MAAQPERIRIAIVAGLLTPGGAEKQLAYHVRCLAESGATLLIVSLNGDGHYGPDLRSLADEFVSIESGGRVARTVKIARAVRRFNPDIVQASHTFANLYAVAAARACGAMSIGALRGVMQTSADANGWLNRWHLTMPDAVVANSRRGAEEVCRLLNRDAASVHVVDNAVDLAAVDREMRPRAELRQLAGLGDADVAVLGVGTLRDGKGFDRYLRVLAAARAQSPQLKGVLIGDGPARAALEEVCNRTPSLRGGVSFAGRHPEAVRLMRGADIFLMTSEHEGVPNTLIEAMAAGLPSVVTPAGDAGRIVEESGSGFVHLPSDEAAMASTLAAIGRSASERSRLGGRARFYVETELDYPLLRARLWRAYSATAAMGHRRGLLARLNAMHAYSRS